MKNIIKYVCLSITLCIFTQCKDYLDTKNPGNSDDEFVTSSIAETFKTLSWAYGEYRQEAGSGGNYKWQDPLGSDAEYLAEYPTVNNPIARLQPTAIPINERVVQFNGINSALSRAARIADMIGRKDVYQSDVAAGKLSDWTQLYGEAKTLWAFCYWELLRHFGDVPFGYENVYVTDYELTSRFETMDNLMDELKAVEPLMYKIGEGGITAERFSRSYANALIGEIALHAGGWNTIRTDVPGLYGSVQFDYKGEDDGMCVYARRKDYMDYIKDAETYLNAAINTHNGTAQLIETDPRTHTNNPFQRHFQEINSRRVSPESLFELGCMAGNGNCEHPYSMGRAGSNNANNPLLNTFAAVRIIPSFFYGAYEPGDKRRDVSMVVTGSDASNGNESLIPFVVGSRIGGGGPCINKWDMNRGDVPNFPNASFRASGVNYCIMRFPDAMLMLAEAKAILGTDNAGAISLVNKVRARAFGDNNHTISSSLSGEALLDAIWNERKLEFLGEGNIRWDMIRSGKIIERALVVRKEQADMIAGLAANGYYTFANSGRTISNYIWTKGVDIDGTTRVTYDCTNENDPALFPGWRGIYNWAIPLYPEGSHNLAIKGLYNYIDPDGAEAAALEADGYTRRNWGIDILNEIEAGRNIWDRHILDGVVGRENKAPRYFHPMPLPVIDQSKGKVTNGYELPNQ